MSRIKYVITIGQIVHVPQGITSIGVYTGDNQDVDYHKSRGDTARVVDIWRDAGGPVCVKIEFEPPNYGKHVFQAREFPELKATPLKGKHQ